MPYTLKKYNGQTLVVIQDGTLDTSSTSLQLPGKNYAGYGFSINQNLTNLLENFANSIEPANKITGQLWFDTAVKKIKVYNGIGFKTLGSIEYGTAAPSNQLTGDMWFNTNTNQLFVFDGTVHKLIGPLLLNPNAAQLVSKRVIDEEGGNLYTILEAQFGNNTIAVFSENEFNIDSQQTPITGFNKIYKGITLPSRTNYPNIQFGGVSKTSESLLVGTQEIPAANFVQNTGSSQIITTDFKLRVEPSIVNGVFTNRRGLFVGASDNFYLGYNAGSSYLTNLSGPNIVFGVTDQSVQKNILSVGVNIVNPVNDSIVNLGSSALKYKNVYANNFYAIDDPNFAPNNSAFRGRVEGTTVSATQGFVGNLTGNVKGNIINADQNVVLNTSGQIANYFGRTTGDHFGNVVNINAGNQIAVDVSGTSTIFTGTFTGVSSSAAAIKIGTLVAPGFVGVPTSSSSDYANTVAVRDGSGNLSAVQFTGLASTAQAVMDETNVARLASTSNAPYTLVVRQADGSINVGNISGTSSNAAKLNGYVQAEPSTPGTLVLRSNGGDIYANIIHGRATSANYADLAEKYIPDNDYPVGTVVAIGGEKEITAATEGDRAIGVISENPAFMMNSNLENGVYVALKGRVPVRVIGAVTKGQRMVSTDAGVARGLILPNQVECFGIALETNNDVNEKLVECVIL
jgi:hypothetical protein